MEGATMSAEAAAKFLSNDRVEALLLASEEQRKKCSPAGALRLPPLLDERRVEWCIPDGAFKHQFAYDNVGIYQLPMVNTEFFGDTKLYKPDQSKDREKLLAPRGIIVSAGLSALDSLRSHGMDLGHIVLFSRLVPFRYVCDWVAGRPIEILLMTAGDIRTSEDTRKALFEGDIVVENVEYAEGRARHVYQDRAGRAMLPGDPFRSEDFT